MALYRIVHASDLHFSARPGFTNIYDRSGKAAWFREILSSNFRDALIPSSFSVDKAAAFSFEIAHDAATIDAIIITGDIATTGVREDLNAAHNFLYGAIPDEWSPIKSSFKPLVGVENMPPVILMPGNHDRYTVPLLYPGSLEFENVFGRYWNFHGRQDNRFPNHKFVRTTFLQKENSFLALCTVDFSLTDPNQADSSLDAYLGQGRVRKRSHSNEALEPLDELVAHTEWFLNESKNKHWDKSPMIWCVHFPPAYPGISRNMQLIDEGELLHCAKQFDVRLILSGHTHKFDDYLARNVSRVVCCGTTTSTATDSGNQYLELLIDTDNPEGLRVVQKCWDSRKKEFTAEAGRAFSSVRQ
jgi:3',5'-cyclic AMP phosphodiesterase CpdA